MPERLADIAAQIQNIRQLGAVVTAMRGIAASRAQQGCSTLAGIEAYANVVSHAISQTTALLPGEPSPMSGRHGERRGMILFCAEQGFVGGFSERVLDFARPHLAGAVTLLLGTRGIAIAKERGVGMAWSSAMATHTGGIENVAHRVAEALYARITDDALSTVDVVFPSFVATGRIEIVQHSLLPLDISRFSAPNRNQPPLLTLSPDILVERLAAEYVYAQVCNAAMHSFVAENEARVAAMVAAKHNIESKLTSLIQHERQLRQEEITTEIIELAAGARASLDDI